MLIITHCKLYSFRQIMGDWIRGSYKTDEQAPRMLTLVLVPRRPNAFDGDGCVLSTAWS